MRVLLLTQWYPPEPVKLPADLAESLSGLGHEVEVLTAFPNYPQGTLYPGYRQKVVRRDKMDGVDVVRVPLYPDHSHSVPKRILNYLSFSLSAGTVGMFTTRRPDVIHVYGSPYTAAIPAWLHSRLRGVPFVFNIVDLWPEALEASGFIRSGFLSRVVGRAARMIYRSAAAIIVVSEGYRRRLIEEGVPPEKISVVSNWVDVDKFTPGTRDETEREKWGLSGRFNVLFAGNIGAAQGLETVIEAASLLRAQKRIQFVIVGDGVALPALRQQAERLGLDNVRFVGRLPETAMPSLFSSVEVLLVSLRGHPLFDITIPHKIFAYMASGKPILAAVAGEAAAVVERVGAGRGCAPSDAAALARAVTEMAEQSPDELTMMGAKGRRAACDLYSLRRLTGEIATILSGVAAGNSR